MTFVPLPAGAAIAYTGTTILKYLVPDWQGSYRIGSNHGRIYGFSGAFAPFGERYALGGATPSDYTFAVNNNDTNSLMYDALNRKEHSSQGRWISPDPAGLAAANPANPQTWNRYAYVMNNPLALIDPFGLATCTDSEGNTSNCPDPENTTTVNALLPPVPVITVDLDGILAGPGFALARLNQGWVEMMKHLHWPAKNGPSWTGVFLKSLLKGPSTGPGSCL